MFAGSGVNKVSYNFVQVQAKDDSTRAYALKVLKKHHIVETRQQEHIMNEKKIMSEARSEFIVRYKNHMVVVVSLSII